MQADAIVCATGAQPVRLKLDGADRAITAKDVLRGAPTGQRVVVIGGGSTGCETAELLGKQGRDVTVVELSEQLAANTGKTAQTILLGHLKGLGVKLMTGARAEMITEDAVLCRNAAGSTVALRADTVVFAVGERPDAALYEALKDAHPAVYNIGDSNGGGILPNAVYEGYTVGCSI